MPTDYDPRARFGAIHGPWAHRTWDLDDLAAEIETWGGLATLIDRPARPAIHAGADDTVVWLDPHGPMRNLGPWGAEVSFPGDLGYRAIPDGYDHAATWVGML